MKSKEIGKLAREDAQRAIAIAYEVPLSGTVDPKDLNLPYEWPRSYVDSPELPARRVASEWDDYLDEERGLGGTLPSILTRFGSGRRVAKEADDEGWLAWQDALIAAFKEASVGFFLTIHIVDWGSGTGEYSMIRSLYVADLRRYETLPMPAWFAEDEEEGSLPLERYLQQCFLPISLSRLARQRRHREHKKFMESIPPQVGG